MTHASPGGLTREHVVWAYRLLLDRDPENEDVIGPKLAGSHDTAELRHHLMTSAEFREKNPRLRPHQRSTIVIKELAPGVRLFIDLSDHVIGLNIVRGQYEEDGIRFVRERAEAGRYGDRRRRRTSGSSRCRWRRRSGRKDGSTRSSRSTPTPSCWSDRSIENRFGDRVGFQRAAVGAAPGTATLTFPVETLNTGGAYLLRDGTAPLAGNQKAEVPIVALDELDLQRPVRFIKMDVEGAEPLVLRGAARLLARRSAADPLRAAPDPARARLGRSRSTSFSRRCRARLPRPPARARRHRRADRPTRPPTRSYRSCSRRCRIVQRRCAPRASPPRVLLRDSRVTRAPSRRVAAAVAAQRQLHHRRAPGSRDPHDHRIGDHHLAQHHDTGRPRICSFISTGTPGTNARSTWHARARARRRQRSRPRPDEWSRIDVTAITVGGRRPHRLEAVHRARRWQPRATRR